MLCSPLLLIMDSEIRTTSLRPRSVKNVDNGASKDVLTNSDNSKKGKTIKRWKKPRLQDGEVGSSEDDFYNLEPEVEIAEHNIGNTVEVSTTVDSTAATSQENNKGGISGLREAIVVDAQGNKRIVCIGDGTNEPPVVSHHNGGEQDPSKPKPPNPNKGLFPCPICDHVSTWKKSLRRHILVIHKNHKPFQCQQCDYAASERIILDRHIVNVHKGESAKPFKCHLCPYSAVERGKLKRHMTSVHEGLRPHKCHICSFSAIDKTRLKRHVSSVHEGAKPFQCPHCDHSTSEKGNLKTHIMSVHLQFKPFNCPICTYNSSEKGTLNRHIRTVHRDVVVSKDASITI